MVAKSRMQEALEWLPARALAASATAATLESTAAAATTTGSAPGSLLARACFVNTQVTAVQIAAVQRGDGAGCFISIGHLDESKTAGLPGIAIAHDVDFFHSSQFVERGLQVFLGCLIRKIPNIDIGHCGTLLAAGIRAA